MDIEPFCQFIEKQLIIDIVEKIYLTCLLIQRSLLYNWDQITA
jgi:hypothetical protein